MEQLILKTTSRQTKGKKITRWNEDGFTKGKSSLTILMKFYHEMTTLMDEGRAVDIVYLDFSNAFGTIFLKIFTDKLLTYGLGGQSVGQCICYNTRFPTKRFCAMTGGWGHNGSCSFHFVLAIAAPHLLFNLHPHSRWRSCLLPQASSCLLPGSACQHALKPYAVYKSSYFLWRKVSNLINAEFWLAGKQAHSLTDED